MGTRYVDAMSLLRTALPGQQPQATARTLGQLRGTLEERKTGTPIG